MWNILVQAACMCCTELGVPSSIVQIFSQKGLSQGSENLHGLQSNKKIRIPIQNKTMDPPTMQLFGRKGGYFEKLS